MKNHFTLLMVIFKKLKISNNIKDVEKSEPCALLTEMSIFRYRPWRRQHRVSQGFRFGAYQGDLEGKVPATRHDSRSSIPGTHMATRGN